LHDSVRNLLPNDHYSMPANSASKQNMAVTKHKDSEYWATGNYDLNRFQVNGQPGSQMNTDQMAQDNEDIVQQDLVAWVALATMHYPTAENMPMTNAIRHGFSIQPWNFFDENPSMDMPHYLRVMGEEVGAGVRNCQLVNGHYENCVKEDPPAVPSCQPPSVDRTHNFEGVW